MRGVSSDVRETKAIGLTKSHQTLQSNNIVEETRSDPRSKFVQQSLKRAPLMRQIRHLCPRTLGQAAPDRTKQERMNGEADNCFQQHWNREGVSMRSGGPHSNRTTPSEVSSKNSVYKLSIVIAIGTVHQTSTTSHQDALARLLPQRPRGDLSF